MVMMAFIYKFRQTLVILFALEAALAVSPFFMHALMIVHEVLPLTLHPDIAFMPRRLRLPASLSIMSFALVSSLFSSY